MATTNVREVTHLPWLGAGGKSRVSSQEITEICIRRAQHARFNGVTVGELCAASCVSERRLRDAFYECFGESPTVRLRSLALHEVRRALVNDPTARDAVTRAASDFGFWHLSRFASQYRKLFGESPRATVARARARSQGAGNIYDSAEMRLPPTAAAAVS